MYRSIVHWRTTCRSVIINGNFKSRIIKATEFRFHCFFVCVTKTHRPSEAFIASKMQEKHSRGNTGVVKIQKLFSSLGGLLTIEFLF